MKRSFLADLGLEKDIIDKIMSEHGASVLVLKNRVKDANAALTAQAESNSEKFGAVLRQLVADGANEKFAKVVARSFDLADIELDGEVVKDWETVAKPYKEEFADVFMTADVAGLDAAQPPKTVQTSPDPFLTGFNQL